MTGFQHYLDHVQSTIAPSRKRRRSRAGTIALFLAAGALAYFGWRML